MMATEDGRTMKLRKESSKQSWRMAEFSKHVKNVMSCCSKHEGRSQNDCRIVEALEERARESESLLDRT